MTVKITITVCTEEAQFRDFNLVRLESLMDGVCSTRVLHTHTHTCTHTPASSVSFARIAEPHHLGQSGFYPGALTIQKLLCFPAQPILIHFAVA